MSVSDNSFRMALTAQNYFAELIFRQNYSTGKRMVVKAMSELSSCES